MKKQTMQFLFGDRELIIKVADLLAAPVDVIVNPANTGLSHGGGVAGQVVQQGGAVIQDESDLFIKEHGQLESGMVAFTSAGQLPYEAIIHAVGPKMGEGTEQLKIQQAVARSLQLCDMHEWKSIAFPAISTGIFGVPLDISAKGFFKAITSFWDARIEAFPEKIIICLTEKNFQTFFSAFQNEAKPIDDEADNNQQASSPLKYVPDDELPVGIVELSEEELTETEGIEDWFK